MKKAFQYAMSYNPLKTLKLTQVKNYLRCRHLARWIHYPPTQEYVLPGLFSGRFNPRLWFSRKYYSHDLFLYSQYFHPSALIENTMKHNFMKYHAQVLPLASAPHWFDSGGKKSELYSYSLVIKALLDSEHEVSCLCSSQPAIERQEDYKEVYKVMLNKAYDLLSKKYKKTNPDLIEVMNKEKEYIFKNCDLSRDERRALNALRKNSLLQRVEEMKNKGIITAEESGIGSLLQGTKTCYEFYAMINHYVNQDKEGTLSKFITELGMDKMGPAENTSMPAEEQFNMKLDELYDIALEYRKSKLVEDESKEENSETSNKDITANL
jgi:hypothetical protein